MYQPLPMQYIEPMFRAFVEQRLLGQIDDSIVYFTDHPEFDNGNFGY